MQIYVRQVVGVVLTIQVTAGKEKGTSKYNHI